jgi:hypothetical protein
MERIYSTVEMSPIEVNEVELMQKIIYEWRFGTKLFHSDEE